MPTQICERFFNPDERLFGAQYIWHKVDLREKVSDAAGAETGFPDGQDANNNDAEKITENELERNETLKQKDTVRTARRSLFGALYETCIAEECY